MVLWTRVVAADMMGSKEVHIYLEVKPTVSAEGLAVDNGGSRISLKFGADLCSTLRASHHPVHILQGH